MPHDVGLVAHNVVRRDGQGRVALEITRALVDRGHRVTVYSRTLDDELAGRVPFRRVPLLPGPRLLDDLWLLAAATVAVRRGAHDVALVMGPCAVPRAPFVYDAQFAHRGWRRTWTADTRPGAYHRVQARAAELLERLVLRRSSTLLASTEQVATDSLPPGGGGPPVVVVPDGVDVGELPPRSEHERDAARRQLRLGDDWRVIGFLGEYHTTRKGLDQLLQAVSGGPAEEHLVVAARGRSTRLAQRAGELGLHDRVHEVGFVPPRQVYAAADVVAVPSIYEPYSLVALEAAASCTPVVVSGRAGAAPLLGDGAVVVADPTDPSAIRAALDEATADPARTAARVAAGRAAVERLTWSHLGPRMAAVVEGVAGRGDR